MSIMNRIKGAPEDSDAFFRQKTGPPSNKSDMNIIIDPGRGGKRKDDKKPKNDSDDPKNREKVASRGRTDVEY